MIESITSKYNVFCDTFNTNVELKTHVTKKGKRKALLSIKDKKGKKEVSLWKEDVRLMARFLDGLADDLDARLQQ